MTEEEWLACGDPEELLQSAWDRVSDRKARLFACACCRSIWGLLCAWGREYLEAVEQVADGRAGTAVLEGWPIPRDDTPAEYAVDLAAWAGGKRLEVLAEVAHWAREAFTRPAAGGEASAGRDEDDVERQDGDPYLRGDEMARQADRVRDIIGNPFHPIAFAPEWRTDTAITLARTMYESHDFAAMPILADALQDVRCNSDDVLSHCRGPGPHVRGCWVIDAVLNKD